MMASADKEAPMRRVSFSALVRALLVAVAVLATPQTRAQVFGPSGPELRVNTYTTGIQAGGSVAIDDFSNFIVVWGGQGEAGESDVHAQRYTFSGPIGSQFRINTYTTSSQHSPRVAAGSLSKSAVVWVSVDQDGDSAGVYGQRLLAGALQGGEFRANATTTGYQSYINVASNGAGDFVVVWAGPNGAGQQDVFGQRYSSTGALQGVNFRVNTYTTGDQGTPAVARNTDGFVVVWRSVDQLPSNGIGIYGQRYDSAGGPLGVAFQINATTTNVGRPSASMDAAGRLVVAWPAAGAGGYSDIYARRYSSAGAPLAAEFRVNSAVSGEQNYPRVSAQSNNADTVGTFVVAWQSGSLYGGTPGVFAQRFVGSGAPVGDAFRVDGSGSGTIGGLDHDLLGNFVITWTDGPGGSQDVFLRRFCRSLAGDANGDNAIDVLDVFHLISRLFAGGPSPVRNSDANGDGALDVLDVFYLINHLFAGGPPPACPIVIE
jgi:hypothetical protein